MRGKQKGPVRERTGPLVPWPLRIPHTGRGRDKCRDRYDIRLSYAHIIPVPMATGRMHVMVMLRSCRKRTIVMDSGKARGTKA